MFNKLTAIYIGSNFEHFSKAQSVDELKRLVFERCKPHITNMDSFSKGAKKADWVEIFKSLERAREYETLGP